MTTADPHAQYRRALAEDRLTIALKSGPLEDLYGMSDTALIEFHRTLDKVRECDVKVLLEPSNEDEWTIRRRVRMAAACLLRTDDPLEVTRRMRLMLGNTSLSERHIHAVLYRTDEKNQNELTVDEYRTLWQAICSGVKVSKAAERIGRARKFGSHVAVFMGYEQRRHDYLVEDAFFAIIDGIHVQDWADHHGMARTTARDWYAKAREAYADLLEDQEVDA